MNAELHPIPLQVADDALPVAGQAPRERADAARNREKVLAAAERLFAEHGAEHVSMDAVAAAAGVGKGTLFRRFSDRSTLARAVLSRHEEHFQDAIIRGPAPLGPGAPPLERLIAFGTEYMSFVEQHFDLHCAAEFGRAGARYRSPVYALYLTHLTMLVRQADPALDAEYVAAVLMGALTADLLRHLRQDRTMSPVRIHTAWRSLVQRLVPRALS
ncbi:MAG: TetR/AcrR family transcriptional regulator [Solirubrobacteraceae bacterium]